MRKENVQNEHNERMLFLEKYNSYAKLEDVIHA